MRAPILGGDPIGWLAQAALETCIVRKRAHHQLEPAAFFHHFTFSGGSSSLKLSPAGTRLSSCTPVITENSAASPDSLSSSAASAARELRLGQEAKDVPPAEAKVLVSAATVRQVGLLGQSDEGCGHASDTPRVNA